MLALTRKVNEIIQIGDHIQVTVTGMSEDIMEITFTSKKEERILLFKEISNASMKALPIKIQSEKLESTSINHTYIISNLEKNDGIMIGNDIEILIERIFSGQGKLRFNAPRSIKIDRQEVRQESKKKDLDLTTTVPFIAEAIIFNIKKGGGLVSAN